MTDVGTCFSLAAPTFTPLYLASGDGLTAATFTCPIITATTAPSALSTNVAPELLAPTPLFQYPLYSGGDSALLRGVDYSEQTRSIIIPETAPSDAPGSFGSDDDSFHSASEVPISDVAAYPSADSGAAAISLTARDALPRDLRSLHPDYLDDLSAAVLECSDGTSEEAAVDPSSHADLPSDVRSLPAKYLDDLFAPVMETRAGDEPPEATATAAFVTEADDSAVRSASITAAVHSTATGVSDPSIGQQTSTVPRSVGFASDPVSSIDSYEDTAQDVSSLSVSNAEAVAPLRPEKSVVTTMEDLLSEIRTVEELYKPDLKPTRTVEDIVAISSPSNEPAEMLKALSVAPQTSDAPWGTNRPFWSSVLSYIPSPMNVVHLCGQTGPGMTSAFGMGGPGYLGGCRNDGGSSGEEQQDTTPFDEATAILDRSDSPTVLLTTSGPAVFSETAKDTSRIGGVSGVTDWYHSIQKRVRNNLHTAEEQLQTFGGDARREYSRFGNRFLESWERATDALDDARTRVRTSMSGLDIDNLTAGVGRTGKSVISKGKDWATSVAPSHLSEMFWGGVGRFGRRVKRGGEKAENMDMKRWGASELTGQQSEDDSASHMTGGLEPTDEGAETSTVAPDARTS